jgi:hypothetical protein
LTQAFLIGSDTFCGLGSTLGKEVTSDEREVREELAGFRVGEYET